MKSDCMDISTSSSSSSGISNSRHISKFEGNIGNDENHGDISDSALKTISSATSTKIANLKSEFLNTIEFKLSSNGASTGGSSKTNTSLTSVMKAVGAQILLPCEVFT